jgi:hypothetical protein
MPKARIRLTLILSATLLVLSAGPSHGRGSSFGGDSNSQTLAPSAVSPWTIATIDPTSITGDDRGQYASMAIDPGSGTIYISYYNASDGDLRVAKTVTSGGNCGPNNTWSCETVDRGGDVGQYSSIAVHPTTGRPGVAYFDDSNDSLKYALYGCLGESCAWVSMTIEAGIAGQIGYGYYASLAYDSSGTPHIAYVFSGQFTSELKYAHYVGSGGNCAAANMWQCDFLPGTGAGVTHTSLDLDGSDRPRIAYRTPGPGELRHAGYVGAGLGDCGPGNNWSCRPVREEPGTDVGRYASLAIDGSGVSHIAYHNTTQGTLEYARYVGSGGNCGEWLSVFPWQCREIDNVGTSEDPMGVSLAMDSAGHPIIAYQSEGDLKVARPALALGMPVGNCSMGSVFYNWYCQLVDTGGSELDEGNYVSVALRPTGLPIVAYYEEDGTHSNGRLKVAYQRFHLFLPLVLRDP